MKNGFILVFLFILVFCIFREEFSFIDFINWEKWMIEILSFDFLVLGIIYLLVYF